MTNIQTFNRLHIPTNTVTEGVFNASQHEVFAEPDFYSSDAVCQAMVECIEKWNRLGGTEWKYWLH